MAAGLTDLIINQHVLAGNPARLGKYGSFFLKSVMLGRYSPAPAS